MKLKKYDIGVIVGRFQINKIHEAHEKIIRSVLKKHKKCIIFIGTGPTLGTKKDPLDYATRRGMIQSMFPEVVISPLKDYNDDKLWVKELDCRITEIFPMGTPCLYGGRDSFIDHYVPYGKYDAYEFPTHDYRSATELREEVGKEIINSEDFRKGIIYSTQNQFPRTHLTVDIAITREEDGNTMVLLGKKTTDKKYRFPGGFVDQNETLEQNVRREANEEVSVSLEGDINYICSMPITDWRYIKSGDTVLTSFFQSEYTYGCAKASDDLAEADWFILKDVKVKDMVDSHGKLLVKLKNFMKERNEQ